MPIDPRRELITGPSIVGGPIGTGTTGSSGSQPGPVNWNPARRMPRANWRSGFTESGAVTLSYGLSSMMARARTSATPHAGRVILRAAFPPVGPTVGALRCLSVGVRSRAFEGRAWIPHFAARSLQPPPLPSVKLVSSRVRWRPGRSAFVGRPSVATPALRRAQIVAVRPPRRGSSGSVSPFRLPLGLAGPSLAMTRATLVPTTRSGNAPRRAGWAAILQHAGRIPSPATLAAVRIVRRPGDDATRWRPGRLSLAQTMGIAFSGRLHYDIYANDGYGGAVVYGSPIAALEATSWTTPALASPGTWSFAVRAADVNGEEQNLDCAVTIVLDALGNDVTGRPAPPSGLRAFPIAGGQVRVEWSYCPAMGPGVPTGFHVYLGSGSGALPDYTSPAAEVAYGAGVFDAFVADLAGLTDGATYSVGVRAFNASGEETNTASITVTADATGPMPVDFLTATAIV